MAVARIAQQFSEHESVAVEVEVSESYPDAVAQAVSEVVRLWREAVPDEAD